MLFGALSLSLQAAAEQELTAFPGAKIVYDKPPEQTYYRLALGPQKKISNVWRAEHSENHTGQLRRLTQELPAGFTREEVLGYYQGALALEKAELLYSCSSRDCGSSNSWANSHFNIKELYGLDQAQDYRAYKIGDGEWLVLYLVQRGNKRMYLQLEQLLQAK